MNYYLIYKTEAIRKITENFIAEEHQVSIFGRDRVVKCLLEDSVEKLSKRMDHNIFGCMGYCRIDGLRTIPYAEVKSGEEFIRTPLTLQEIKIVAKELRLDKYGAEETSLRNSNQKGK